MAEMIRDVMTRDPVVMDATDTTMAAAQVMRDRDVGDVLVRKGDALCGIVTDRDIVIRALAEGLDPSTTKLGDVCSAQPFHTVTPEDDVDRAVELMRQKAVRRLPVMQDGNAVGIVSIGDLAVDRDRRSALADISSAPPNE